MNSAAVIIEYAVSIHRPHLDSIAVLAPKIPGDLLPLLAKVLNHSLLVVFIK
jgi:hypothetical protein